MLSSTFGVAASSRVSGCAERHILNVNCLVVGESVVLPVLHGEPRFCVSPTGNKDWQATLLVSGIAGDPMLLERELAYLRHDDAGFAGPGFIERVFALRDGRVALQVGADGRPDRIGCTLTQQLGEAAQEHRDWLWWWGD